MSCQLIIKNNFDNRLLHHFGVQVGSSSNSEMLLLPNFHCHLFIYENKVSQDSMSIKMKNRNAVGAETALTGSRIHPWR